MIRFFRLSILFTLVCFTQASALNLEISYISRRHAFIREENPTLQLAIANPSAQALGNTRIKVEVDGLEVGNLNGATLAAQDTTRVRLSLDMKKIRAGKYEMVVFLFNSQSREIGKNRFPLYLREKPKDKMRVWLWPHQKFSDQVCGLDESSLKTLEWYADKGFNSFQPGGDVDHQEDHDGLGPEKLQLFDYALYRDWEMGFAAAGGFNQRVDSPEATFEPLNFSKTGKRFSNPFSPETIKDQIDSNLRIMEQVKDFPAVKTCFFNSEKEDKLPPRLMPVKTSFLPGHDSAVPHRFILPGVIPDHDEGYLEHKNRYEWTDGLSVANQRAASVVHAFRPDIAVFSDPLRRTAVFGRYRGMDLISSWTYTNPDPKFMLFIETLIANAKPSRQGVMHTITMLNYPGAVAPKKQGWTLMGADRLLETSWINLSRKPDRFSIYISSMCDPFNPDIPKGDDLEKSSHFPYQLNPESFEAFKRFSQNVIEPFGPMVKKLERSRRRVAILSSEASRVYSASPRLLGYYDNYQIYCFYSLLSMAHIPTDVVFEETIGLCGLDGYDALVLAKCDTLLESTFKAILDFQARGGTVVADQYLRAPIPNTIPFDFDFEYRTKVSASAILENAGNTKFTDYLDERSENTVEVKGVTALDDQKTMLGYARQLQAGLGNRIPRKFDCSTETALLNLLEKDRAQYLFVINDKRTYDPRFGPFKAILGESVPQAVALTARNQARQNLHFYDMVEKRELETQTVGSDIRLNVSLSSLGGTIIAVLPVGIGDIAIESPQIVEKRCVACNLDIIITDTENNPLCGVTPLKIEITDPAGNPSGLSGYYAADKGRLNIKFTPALNDTAGKWTIRATELVSGKNTRRTLRLKKEIIP